MVIQSMSDRQRECVTNRETGNEREREAKREI